MMQGSRQERVYGQEIEKDAGNSSLFNQLAEGAGRAGGPSYRAFRYF
jgi:hypothetical protein